MRLRGGYTTYGQDIGVLMLDTQFPRLPGDVGNNASYPNVHLRYKVVKNAYGTRIMGKNPDPELLRPFIDAARELEADGCKAITTSCGFLAAFQKELASAVHVPVFTSAMILVPLIQRMINPDQEIAIFTERAWNLTENHLNQLGFSTKDIPVVVTGMPEGSPFPGLFIENNLEEDLEVLEECMREMTIRNMKEHPNTGAIVFECTNMGPFSKVVQDIAKVPVFGLSQLVEYMASVVNVPRYY